MKNIYRILGISVIFIVAFLSSFLFHSVIQNKPQENIWVSIEYRQKTEGEVNRIKEAVENIRGLNITSKIEIIFVNTEWAKRHWAPKADEIPKELLLKELFYKVTFFIDWNTSIVDLSSQWIGMFVAATSGYNLYINVDYFSPDSPRAKNVLAHELTHIIQYQHFKIEWPKQTDSEKALSALIEGDAGLTQKLFCLTTGECEPSQPWSISFENLYLTFAGFPYIYGEKFVEYLYEIGGWELVNRAYKKPPINTYMVIFPDTYLEYLLSQKDSDVSANMSTISLDNEKLFNDTMGAYYLLLLVGKREGYEMGLSVSRGWLFDYVLIYYVEDVLQINWYIVFRFEEAKETFKRTFYTLLESYADRIDENIYKRNVHNGKILYKLVEIDQNALNIEVKVSGDMVSNYLNK